MAEPDGMNRANSPPDLSEAFGDCLFGDGALFERNVGVSETYLAVSLQSPKRAENGFRCGLIHTQLRFGACAEQRQ